MLDYPKLKPAYAHLENIKRLELAPTPLTETTCGFLLKRDDLCGVEDYSFPSGKLRKIAYILEDLMHEGSNVVLVSGNVQSNHARMLAQVCAKHKLPVYCFYQNDTTSEADDIVRGGNVMLADLGGANILLSEGSSTERQIMQAAEGFLDVGHRPYISTRGGSCTVGDLGYFDAAFELCDQVRERGHNAATLFVCSGSGGTHAALHLGAAYLRLTSGFDLTVIGVPNKRTCTEQAKVVSACIDNLKSLLVLPDDDSYIGELHFNSVDIPYGEVNELVARTTQGFFQTEGLLLDPVYTVKTLIAMQQALHGAPRRDQPVILLNGGAAANSFAYRSSYQTWSENYNGN